MKEEVEKVVDSYKDKLSDMIMSEINKITGGNKQTQELVQKLISDVSNNLNNPQQLKTQLENTVQQELSALLKKSCEKLNSEIQSKKDTIISQFKQKLETTKSDSEQQANQKLTAFIEQAEKDAVRQLVESAPQ